MKSLKVVIQGIAPLLMNAYRGEQPEGYKNMSPADQAEFKTYRDPKTKELYLPVDNISRALISGATYSKGKRRASLQKEVAAALFVDETKIPLGTKTYEVDSRRVVIPVTGGCIMAHRPRINEWSASFTITFDETLLTADQVRKVLEDTGTRVGLMDFRPEKKGPYGRFVVKSIK